MIPEAMDEQLVLLKRVKEIKEWEQGIVFVEDVSPTMGELGITGQPKAQESAASFQGCVARLDISRYADNFVVGAVRFSHVVDRDFLPLQPVHSVGDLARLELVDPDGRGTAIGDGLAAAYDIARAWMDAGTAVPRTAVLVVLTDGKNNTGEDPVAVAERIKQDERVTICAAGYGTGENIDENVLRQIVSRPDCYVLTRHPEELREFFYRSVSTVTQ